MGGHLTKANIIAGQNVYQRYGLMDQGAVWGHGSQRGPEFSATSLKIIADAIGDYYIIAGMEGPLSGDSMAVCF